MANSRLESLLFAEMGDLREPETDRVFTMDEVREHSTKDDAWIVIDDTIYDVSNFWKKHPGGQQVMLNFAGRDASVRLATETVNNNLLIVP